MSLSRIGALAGALCALSACAALEGLNPYSECTGSCDASVDAAPLPRDVSTVDTTVDAGGLDVTADIGQDVPGDTSVADTSAVVDAMDASDAADTGTEPDAEGCGPTNTTSNCAACGNACDTAHSQNASCDGTTCKYTGCAPGWLNCNTAAPDLNGCETMGPSCDAGTSCQTTVSAAATGYDCPTTLPAPAPVCDSTNKYCECTSDSQCNSNGLSYGGCAVCDGGTCTGLLYIDNAGCSAVNPYCTVMPNNTGCPGNTTCVTAMASRQDQCGNAILCCWCTSDNGCAVSHKCINDPTKHQCTGTCTGTGSNWDAMHCQLTSPGIPMCQQAYSCPQGNCSDITSPNGVCTKAGTPCFCISDNQCQVGKCLNWAGCAPGACTGTGAPDCFNCTAN